MNDGGWALEYGDGFSFVWRLFLLDSLDGTRDAWGLDFSRTDDFDTTIPPEPNHYSFFGVAFAVLAERLRDYYYFLFCFLAESEWVKERKSEDMIERYNDNITTL